MCEYVPAVVLVETWPRKPDLKSKEEEHTTKLFSAVLSSERLSYKRCLETNRRGRQTSTGHPPGTSRSTCVKWIEVFF